MTKTNNEYRRFKDERIKSGARTDELQIRNSSFPVSILLVCHLDYKVDAGPSTSQSFLIYLVDKDVSLTTEIASDTMVLIRGFHRHGKFFGRII